MQRSEEYHRLLTELENTPPALEYAVKRARARAEKAKRIHHFVTIPVSGLALFLLAFVLLVNVSTPFAMACGRIPLLRELASAVAMSPSLRAAVANHYVQPIELEQSQNGITMRVEYVIVDQKQLNIFYSLQSPDHPHMEVEPYISHPDGTALDGYTISYSGVDGENNRFRQITVDFIDRDMPGSLRFGCKVRDSESHTTAPLPANAIVQEKSEYMAEFVFPLHFDPAYTRQGQVITLNQTFVLAGQRLTATTVEIYPTHMRLNLADDKNNTAWLQGLTFYAENEKGQRFEAVSNGITASGSVDSPFMASHRLESSFFSQSRNLTLYITGSVWLDKDMERVRIDLARGTADKLPAGVKIEQALRQGNDWQLTFSGTAHQPNSSYQLFGGKYYDEAGHEYEFNSWSTLQGGLGEKSGRRSNTPTVFTVQFTLTNYPFDSVYLSPSFSRAVTPASPVKLRIK